ncbi:FG-GAP-like repeat-containing protein [Pedobacter sp. SYSU D00535]|uniref:FG-GAP-like repeat-containing protein n=1 Tax=Pedobacter sp. SYSU D00535 TaxID=2810308 RepID=UPI001A97D169|nr:FG-GAP-like repeat-containing protein [Pedobacter sp. SYSU D00535]
MSRLYLFLFTVFISFRAFSQSPSIVGISPDKGTPGTTITITGANFGTGPEENVVYFGGAKAAVIYASTTEIVATVPQGASYLPLSVTTRGLTAYSSKPFVVTQENAQPLTSYSFSVRQDQNMGDQPVSVIVCDFNGDGKNDVATAHFTSSAISVAKNISSVGSVSFAPKLTLENPRGPAFLAHADLDGDGKQDLVMANYGDENEGGSTISIHRNISTETDIAFAPMQEVECGSYPSKFFLSDLNLDGRAEIILLNETGFFIMRNVSTGNTIAFSSRINIMPAYNIVDIAVADLDGDNKPEILVVNDGTVKAPGLRLSVLKNASSNSVVAFPGGTDFRLADGIATVSTAELNGDNLLDVVLLFPLSDKMAIYKNTSTSGSIALSDISEYVTQPTVSLAKAADLEGDGKVDLVLVNEAAGSLSVLRNSSANGQISFSSKLDFPTLKTPTDLAISDLDGDSKPDLLAGYFEGSTISIFRNLGAVQPPIISSFSPAMALPGHTVTITGSNLDGASAVSFGGTPAASFVINSSSSITAVVGSGASGEVSVTTPGGASSKGGFNYVDGLSITAQGPTTFTSGNSVVLTVNTGSLFTYQWSRNGVDILGARGPSFTAVAGGSYTVSVFNGDNRMTSAPVDVKSIFVLPASNFRIQTKDESCKASNNGAVIISAENYLNYRVKITGEGLEKEYTFSVNQTIDNLPAGSYKLFLTVENEPEFELQFDVIINEPKDLEVISYQEKEKLVLQLAGGRTYQIRHNDRVFTTSSNSVSLNLEGGENTIAVVTDKDCQGVFERSFMLNPEPQVYPSPFVTEFKVRLSETDLAQVETQLLGLDGRVVHRLVTLAPEGTVTVDPGNIPPGMYVLKIKSDRSESTVKVLKK